MRWIEALRIWNDKHKSKDCPGWTIPRKGTDDNKAVRAIMDEDKKPKKKVSVMGVVYLWEHLSEWITKNVEKEGEHFVMKPPFNKEADYEYEKEPEDWGSSYRDFIPGKHEQYTPEFAGADFPLIGKLKVYVELILHNKREIKRAVASKGTVPKEQWGVRFISVKEPSSELEVVAHPTNVMVEGTQKEQDELVDYLKKHGKPKGYPWKTNPIEAEATEDKKEEYHHGKDKKGRLEAEQEIVPKLLETYPQYVAPNKRRKGPYPEILLKRQKGTIPKKVVDV